MSSINAAFTGMRGVAMDVFRAVERANAGMGEHRGDITRATKAVAIARRMKYDSVKRAVSRNRELRPLAKSLWITQEALTTSIDRQCHALDSIAEELTRRMLGMPEDVKALLGGADAIKLLEFLRAHNIDITCPDWLVDAVRGSHDLMSPN
jgi:hypothetical protein